MPVLSIETLISRVRLWPGASRSREGGLQLRGVPEGARVYGCDPLASCMAANSQASGTL